MSTVEHWRCAYHNRRLAVAVGGRWVCDDPDVGFCMVIQADEVAIIKNIDRPYALLEDGSVLRNVMNPIVIHDDDEPHVRSAKELRLQWLANLLNADATHWWHLFGGELHVLPESETEHHGPTWTTAVVGPVVEDADSILRGTAHVVSAGIDVDSGGHVSHMALIGSWTHDPTNEEKRDAEGKALAAKVVRDLHDRDKPTRPV